MSGPGELSDQASFASSREHFESVCFFLGSEEVFGLDHSAIEERLEVSSRKYVSPGCSMTISISGHYPEGPRGRRPSSTPRGPPAPASKKGTIGRF